ncbi:hypothetical protein BDF21DRAFT_394835 [Thamnidium elegans]|nr:hypothetical protein BDF21DRAFT_394835 [Thamnidium elegans]
MQCHEVYTTFYDQMRDISYEYSKANERLDRIRQELLIANRIEELCQTISNGTMFSLLTVSAAEKMILARIIAGNISLVSGPIHFLYVASLYTVVSRFSMYYGRKSKKSSLSKALVKVSELLGNLLEMADAFNKSHTDALNEVNTYLRSIDNMVRRSSREGPLSHSVLIDGMLEKTEKIITTFEGMTTTAEKNAEIFRKGPLRINQRSIINS